MARRAALDAQARARKRANVPVSPKRAPEVSARLDCSNGGEAPHPHGMVVLNCLRCCARSLWFKLFNALDPVEAAAAAAAAPKPAPGTVVVDDFNDHDFQRRFIEQFCARPCATLTRSCAHADKPRTGWRRTDLCSRCFVRTSNAAIHLWKVRLCSPCMAASILNKSALPSLHVSFLRALTVFLAADAAKTFLIGPKELNALSTWDAGIVGPFGAPVQFYFRRHLERVRLLCCIIADSTR